MKTCVYLVAPLVLFFFAPLAAAAETEPDLDKLWAELAEDDAQAAYRAVKTLVVQGQPAVSLIKDRLRPVPEPDAQLVKQLIADLNADQFAVRQKATDGLERLGNLAIFALRRALDREQGLEVRQRIEQIQIRIEQCPLSSEELRAVRAAEVLEGIGSSQAKELLAVLAKGAENAPLTLEARASLQRLAKSRKKAGDQ